LAANEQHVQGTCAIIWGHVVQFFDAVTQKLLDPYLVQTPGRIVYTPRSEGGKHIPATQRSLEEYPKQKQSKSSRLIYTPPSQKGTTAKQTSLVGAGGRWITIDGRHVFLKG